MQQNLGGVWYEPRSLWSVRSVSPRTGDFLTPLTFDREHFRNPGPYPITLTRVALAAVNYPYRVSPVTNPANNFPSQANGSQILNDFRVKWSVPYRQDYSRSGVIGATWRPRPTAEPQPLDNAGSTYGVCRLDFEKPLYLPQFGSIQTRLSSVADLSYVPVGAAPPAAFNVLAASNVNSVNAQVSYYEEGGLFAGSARTRQLQLPVSRSLNTTTDEGWPWPIPPGFAAPIAPLNNVPFWAPQGTFSSTEFDRQESTRSGSTKLLGVSVFLDQIAYDAAWLTVAPFNSGTLGRVAPLSQRVGCDIRVTNGGGGGASWWRPGAPIALVMDSITPAVVYDLDEPITLKPGDAMQVVGSIPGLAFGEAGGQPATRIASSYIFGVSFNGFATIEG